MMSWKLPMECADLGGVAHYGHGLETAGFDRVDRQTVQIHNLPLPEDFLTTRIAQI